MFFCPLSVSYLCASCGTMKRGKELTKGQIAGISFLSLGGIGNKQISAITGLVVRSVQRWTKKCRDAGDADLLLQKKRTGKACFIDQKILKVLQRQVDLEPHISAKEPKEKKLRLLRDVSVPSNDAFVKTSISIIVYPQESPY